MTTLSVNVNKIAVLRNSRGGQAPDVVRAARACLDAGAHGITVHPRPDARHIRADDVLALAALCHERGVEFNLEGNPFAPPREGYPGFHALCAQARPAQATLVPDGDAPDEDPAELVSDLRNKRLGLSDTVYNQIKRFTEMCGASIPDELERELNGRADDPDAVAELGVAYATLQCSDLLARGAPGIHFYTLNRSPATRAILAAVRGYLATDYDYPSNIAAVRAKVNALTARFPVYR